MVTKCSRSHMTAAAALLALWSFASCVSDKAQEPDLGRKVFKTPAQVPQVPIDRLDIDRSFRPTNAVTILIPYFKAASAKDGQLAAKAVALELRKTGAWVPVSASFSVPAKDDEALLRAKEAGADAVLLGELAEYGQVPTGVVHVASVSISMRALEAGTGKTIWSAGHRKVARTPWRSTESHFRSTLEGVIAALCKGWVEDGMKAWCLQKPQKAEALAGVRKIVLNWLPSTDGDAGFEISRKGPGQDDFRSVSRLKGAKARYEWFDRGLADTTSYSYTICALSKYGLKGEAVTVQAETLGPPAAPIGLSATSGQVRKVPLNWTASEDPSVSEYVIYRSEDGGKESLVGRVTGRATTQHLDSGTATSRLADGVAYTYRVVSRNSAGVESESSASVRATTMAGPEKVGGLEASVGLPQRVELAWEASSSPDSVAGYIVERSETSPGPYVELGRVVGAMLTRYIDRQSKGNRLVEGREYYYRVVPFNRGNLYGQPCEPVAAVTKPLPAQVVGLLAESKVREVSLSWNQSFEPDIAHYEVWRAGEPTDKATCAGRVGAASTSFTDSLPGGDGAPFYYSVVAVDVDGLKGAASEQVQGSTLLVISPPENLQCKTEPGEVVLSWKQANDEAPSSYFIYSESWMSRARIAETTGRVYTVKGLRPGKQHQYSVTAVDTNGVESFPSQPVKFIAR